MSFDPNEHLREFTYKNRDGSTTRRKYLDVAWRVVWFREVHPDGTIETELIRFDDPFIVRATVTIPGVGEDVPIIATGTKMVRASEWKSDPLAKAETGAIGRALALLGFGTQFTGDELEGMGPDDVVDSPAPAKSNNGTSKPPKESGQPGPADTADPNRPMTNEQRAALDSLKERAGLDDDQIGVVAGELFPERERGRLTFDQAGSLIRELQKRVKAAAN